MTREEAIRQLEKINAQLDANRVVQNVQGGPAGAFVNPGGAGTTVTGERPPVLPPEKGGLQKVSEFAVPAGMAMVGASRAVAATAPLAAEASAVSPLLGGAVTVGSAMAGAYAGGAGGSLTMDGAKRALNLPGAPDSFDEAMQTAAGEGSDQMWGELWGQGAGKVLSGLSPYRRAVGEESANLFKQQATRLRSAYEEIAGSPLMENKRTWWNPMRWKKPASELDDAAVVSRLEAQGLDPEAARKVALTGGLLPSRIENSTFSKLWGIVSNSKTAIDPKVTLYNEARTKLMSEAALQDLGTSFTKMVPPEQLGEVIHGALNKQFDVLTGARQLASNAIGFNVPAGTKFDVSALKKAMPADIAGGGLLNMAPDRLTWENVQGIRSNLGKMAHDGDLSDVARGQAKWLADRLDERVTAGLKDVDPRLAKQYKAFAKSDDAIHAEGYNDKFVLGMLKENPGGMRAYADKIIKSADVGNFQKLERAMSKVEGGEQIMANLRGSISDKIVGAAAPNGTLQPHKLMGVLGTESKGYGRYFFNSTMGPEYIQNWDNFAKVMDTVNDAAHKAGNAIGGVRGIATAGTTYGAISNMFHGGGSAMDYAYIATALGAPTVISKALTSTTHAKILMKVAENVAAGRNPKTTARLAARVLEYADMAPEDWLKGWGVLPQEQEDFARMRQQAMQGQPPPLTGGQPMPTM